MMRTSNPALNQKTFDSVARAGGSAGVMTLEGTVNKTVLSVALTTIAACVSWMNPALGALYIPFILVATILAIVLVFKKEWAPTLVPAYAVLEGLAMGSFSLFAETMYPGIVFQAVTLTFGTLFALLMAYRSGWINPSENFKLGLVAATGGICILYLSSLIFSLFGVNFSFLYSNGPLSIGISCVVVVIAALNLVLDFDFIENASKSGSMPKYMEWYGAFGLLVTLVWLYIEILRLLMKLNSRD